jgi:TetR/AcrR family transcriptional regulator, lmrAB and yxaGH operons repressor
MSPRQQAAARAPSGRNDILPLLAEVFRAHGYEGATLALISEATGLGKGSLYHFFPGGKQQMAAEVLVEIDRWFEMNVFAPLRESKEPKRAIVAMIDNVDAYFRSGRRICLVGVIALGSSRDMFVEQVKGYFVDWKEALAGTLRRAGLSASAAKLRAEEALVAIQGALILARAEDDAGVFRRAMADLRTRLLAPQS